MIVIVATDGSAPSVRAAREGLTRLAAPERVVVVTAMPVVDEMMVTGTGLAGGVATPQMYDEMVAARRAEGEAIVARVAEVLAGFPVETVVAWGDAGSAVCALAEDLGASVVVVGSRGLGGVKRFLLGSVSTHVVRNAPCPVLVVPDADGS